MRHLLTAAAVLLAGVAHAAEPAEKRPNVLLIVADDMGFSDAGCYGGEIATPHLDALAKNGLRFTQFYNTSRCWPTRAALLTGYYAQQVRRDAVPGVKSGGDGVRPAWARLLPEMLRPPGYRSYHSGKWHVDGKPLRNGFDRSYSLDDHDRHFALRRHNEDDRPLPPVGPGAGYYSSTAIADHAIRCLTEHAEKHPRRPFLAYVAFTAPHFPLHAREEDVAPYRRTYLAGWDALREERWRRLKELKIVGGSLAPVERDVGPPYAFPDAVKKLGPNELNRPLPWKGHAAQRAFQANKMAVHAAMVSRMDREIGRVVARVRAMGALDDTLAFFLSDNGASAEIMVRGDGHDPHAHCGTGATFLCAGPGWSSLANTPFRRHKTWAHEGGIATPLIVHWPRGIAARGELRHAPGHVIDLVPTVLEAAGVKRPEKWEDRSAPPSPGKSLVPLFAKDGAVARDSLWWLHEGNRALRVGDGKIVAAGKDSPWELYDLGSDRSETRDLAGDRPEKVRELAAIWAKQLEDYSVLAAKDLPPDRKMHFPGKQWEVVRPEAEGLDAKKLAGAVAYLKKNAGRDGVKELVVVRRGRVVWHGDDVDKVHGVWSCTKSFTSTALGLLIDDKKFALDTKAATVLPVLTERYPAVTLRHFTTMTSGYTAAGEEPKGGYLHGPSDTPFVPGKPLFASGEKYAYWDSAMNQFGLVLTKIAGEPLDALLRRRVMGPIGADPEKWRWGERKGARGLKVNSGSGNGGGHVQISAREMARLGHLFLNEGSWDGKRLLSKEWVRQATSVQVSASVPQGFPASKIAGSGCYGFNWWVNGVKPDGKRKWPGAPAATYAAMGHNNNLCVVVPEWRVVVVRLGLDQGDLKIGDAAIGEFLKRVGEAVTD